MVAKCPGVEAVPAGASAAGSADLAKGLSEANEAVLVAHPLEQSVAIPARYAV